MAHEQTSNDHQPLYKLIVCELLCCHFPAPTTCCSIFSLPHPTPPLLDLTLPSEPTILEGWPTDVSRSLQLHLLVPITMSTQTLVAVVCLHHPEPRCPSRLTLLFPSFFLIYVFIGCLLVVVASILLNCSRLVITIVLNFPL